MFTFIFLFTFLFVKASDGNRTRDLFTTNEVRYRLCHASLFLPYPYILTEHPLNVNNKCSLNFLPQFFLNPLKRIVN